MVIATFVGGLFMAGVQFEALHNNVMNASDSNDFIVLLRLLMVMGAVPSAALQTIYAQQSAAALTDDTRGQLTVSVRALMRIAFVFWLALAVPGLIFAAPSRASCVSTIRRRCASPC